MPLIRPENLKVGMVVGEDIFSAYGSILVNAGDVLDEWMIEKIQLHGIKFVKVVEDKRIPEPYLSRSTQTVNPVMLSVFTQTYEKKATEVQNVFEQITNLAPDTPVEESLSDVTNEILGAIGGQSEVFHYIHKMKQVSPSIYTHSINVSLICNLFATLLDFPEQKKEQLTLAGLLHDIGKAELGLDVKCNSVTMDSLDPAALEHYRKHSIVGYRILTEKGLPKAVCLGTLMHHEAEGGTGFPTGACWDQIHEFGKIIAIANFYDHMTFSGSMRKELNPFAIIKLLERVQFTKFDIKFVSSFLKRMATYYLNEWVELTTGEVGQIVFINQNDLAHPIVKIGNVFVDLSREPEIDIKRVI